MKTQAYFRLAVFTLICTLSLVTLGGVVHNTGSSLACPDWPLCFGQVFPKMEGGVAIEHSHRLLGSWVGLCVIGLVYLSSKIRREFPALFKGSLLALFVVVFQGVLGGVTVLLGLSPLVSSAHLATSQLFLALLLWLCFTAGSGAEARRAKAAAPGLRKVFLAGTVLLYAQMILGAAIRHGGAGEICGLGSQSTFFCSDPVTSSATLWPSLLPARFHMFHRFLAVLAGVVLIGGSMPLLRWARQNGRTRLRKLGIAVHALWLAQVILGILSVGTYLSPVLVTLHLVGAASLWLCSLSFLLESGWLAGQAAAQPAVRLVKGHS